MACLSKLFTKSSVVLMAVGQMMNMGFGLPLMVCVIPEVVLASDERFPNQYT